MNLKTVATGVVVFLVGSAIWKLWAEPMLEKVAAELRPSPQQHPTSIY